MKSILIVEDMQAVAEPIASVLKQRGYECNLARNGEDAWAMVLDHAPDLILLDLAMPRMDGLSFLRNLRAMRHLAELPVIVLSASQSRDDIVQSSALGVKDYLLKGDLSLENLFERIQNHVGEPMAKAMGPNNEGEQTETDNLTFSI